MKTKPSKLAFRNHKNCFETRAGQAEPNRIVLIDAAVRVQRVRLELSVLVRDGEMLWTFDNLYHSCAPHRAHSSQPQGGGPPYI